MSLLAASIVVMSFAHSVAEVGTQKQLFVDGALIASSEGIKLKINQPLRDGRVTLKGQVPGNHLDFALYNTILKEGGKYRTWYEGKYPGYTWSTLCYAESEDGLNFVVPDLGIVDVGVPNNITFPFEPSLFEPGCVFIDQKPGVPPDQRYKVPLRWEKPGTKGCRTYVAHSPDGIHWKPYNEPSFRDSDTGNVVMWDDRVGRYVAYVRKWDSRGRDVPPRVVARCEFDDMADWGAETIVFASDEQDPATIDFYTNAAVKYEGIYLIFPSTLHHPPEEQQETILNYGEMDVQLAASRDGIHWTRVERRPFVPLSEFSEWDSGIIYMFTGLVVHEKEIWMYYWARNYPHLTRKIFPEKPMDTGFGRLQLRRDGFVSADASYEGGEITTVPLIFRGNRLELNLETSVPGMAKVEILGAEGKAIPGFSLHEADEIRGNFIRKTVTWAGKDDVSSLSGKTIQLHFVMRDAKLYAFQFVD